MNKYHCHIISNTHWDREWRYPFQAYRMDLVDMMDRLIELLEKREDYRAFFLDSQTVILEDYLEIRPENKEGIKKQVRAGRLQIGPWYTLPDEWACHGEAIIRNLLMGHRTAKPFGPVAKVGYTPFSNGQISQLPQIYQGFGIDSCFFYRGVGKHVAPSDFLWESPNGSRVYGFRFGDYARYNYYFLVYRPGLLGRFPENRQYQWNPEEIPFHMATEQHQDRQYSWLNQKIEVHPENLDRALNEAIEYTSPDARTEELLYMMGHDHSYALEAELDLIEAIQKKLGPDREEIFHSSLEDYMRAFRKKAINLKTLRGEMRHVNKEGLWTNLMALILSSRLYLKQRNSRINGKLLYQTEPAAVCSALCGMEYPEPYLEIAWKKMLINQAHDAIGGCSVDRVHEEMQGRWNEVDTLCDEIIRRSLMALAKGIDGSALPKDSLQLAVFNSLPQNRTTYGEFLIDLPHATKGKTFTISTFDGKPISCQILDEEKYQPTMESGYELPMPFDVYRRRVVAQLETLPAMGYRALKITPGAINEPTGEDIAKSETELENEFLRVTLNPNGSLNLQDKKSGRTMANLGYFEDTAEFGDPWNRITPDKETPITSLQSRATSTILHNGPLQGTISAKYNFSVPDAKGENNRRSEETVEISVEVQITLRKGMQRLDLKFNVENQARDHRLRLLFPSGVSNATHSFAEGQYDILERPVELPPSEGWKEAPYPTHPMWNFCGVSDEGKGLAVINDGLTEYEVMDDEARTIAITLIRAYGKFVFGRPTPGAQCLGNHTYRFALYPFKGSWQTSQVQEETADFLTPVQALQSAPTQGKKPAERSFFWLNPSSIRFGALKRGEDGKTWILRCWNSSEKKENLILESCLPLKNVYQLNMEEKVEQQLSPENDFQISCPIRSKQILTLGLEIEPEIMGS